MVCLRGRLRALRTGVGKMHIMISVAVLNEALNSQKARKSMHRPLLIVVSQLSEIGWQEKIPTNNAEIP